MTYLLDTNIVILILKNQAAQGERVAGKLRSMPHDLTLVTPNSREFCRVPNLKVEDWA